MGLGTAPINECVLKLLSHILTDLEATTADRGADGALDLVRARSVPLTHPVHRSTRDSSGDAAPAGMHGSDRNARGIDHQNRHAIRRAYPKQLSEAVRSESIRGGPLSGCAAIHTHDDVRVNLLERRNRRT